MSNLLRTPYRVNGPSSSSLWRISNQRWKVHLLDWRRNRLQSSLLRGAQCGTAVLLLLNAVREKALTLVRSAENMTASRHGNVSIPSTSPTQLGGTKQRSWESCNLVGILEVRRKTFLDQLIDLSGNDESKSTKVKVLSLLRRHEDRSPGISRS